MMQLGFFELLLALIVPTGVGIWCGFRDMQRNQYSPWGPIRSLAICAAVLAVTVTSGMMVLGQFQLVLQSLLIGVVVGSSVFIFGMIPALAAYRITNRMIRPAAFQEERPALHRPADPENPYQSSGL